MAEVSKLWPPGPLDTWGDILNWWGYLAGKLGASADMDRPFLICLRGVEPNGDGTHPMHARRAYDDTGVLLYRGGVRVFPMSSHAYQTDSKLSPDVDGDGRGDVGSIRPGRYLLRDLQSGKYPSFLLTTVHGDGHVPCFRDTNHDGLIDHSEEERLCTATAVLFHLGFDAPPDSEHRSSIACQTASLEWLQLMHERAKATGGGVIDYVLINADAAVRLVAPRDGEIAQV